MTRAGLTMLVAVAVCQVAEVAPEMLVERVIEMVCRAEIGLDFGRQAALAVEGSTRRHPDHEKRNRNHYEQGRDRAQQSLESVIQHEQAPAWRNPNPAGPEPQLL